MTQRIVDESDELTAGFQSALGLPRYEARAYLALVSKGELSPSRLSQISGVPRPRTYDVLRTLADRGFVTERPGRPVRYAPVDPKFAVESRLNALEEGTKRELQERRRASEKLKDRLVKIFEDTLSPSGDQRVTVGSTTNTIWRQLELLKSGTTKKYVAVAINPSVPPYALFAADLSMLERGVKFRLIRPFPTTLGRRHAEWYRRIVAAGAEVRTSSRVEFAFDVSDTDQSVLWLNESGGRLPTEAIWLRHRPVAALLSRNFEDLWHKSSPVDFGRIGRQEGLRA